MHWMIHPLIHPFYSSINLFGHPSIHPSINEFIYPPIHPVILSPLVTVSVRSRLHWWRCCVSLQEDVCWRNAREAHPVPEENQDGESASSDRRGRFHSPTLCVNFYHSLEWCEDQKLPELQLLIFTSLNVNNWKQISVETQPTYEYFYLFSIIVVSR